MTVTPEIMMFCDTCGDDRAFQVRTEAQEIEIRGEPVTALIKILQCPICGNKQPHPDIDPLAKFYEEYRERNQMLSPSEIERIRNRYAMSAESFAAVLGMSPTTIYRYEGGALQDLTHDNLIRLCRDPWNMQRLVATRRKKLTTRQHEKFLEAIRDLLAHVGAAQIQGTEDEQQPVTTEYVSQSGESVVVGGYVAGRAKQTAIHQ